MDLDPRWEWHDVTVLGEPPGSQFIKGTCNHLPEHVVDVTDVEGYLVAKLCTTCDTQFTLEETSTLSARDTES